MMQSIRVFVTAIAGLGIALLSSGSAMAEPEAQGRFNDWAVYTLNDGGDTICYATTPAEDKAPRNAEHGDVFLFVSNSKSGSRSNQPSIMVGFPLREDLAPTARISRRTWTLFARGNEAFAPDQDDPDIIAALKRGSELRVEAVSERGTAVTYHFSLSGSSAAIDRASSLCR